MVLIPIDEVVHFDVVTSNPSTGAASDADSTPTFAVYEEATDTDILGGPTNLTKRTSLTGNYRGTFTASAANGFEAGKWYSVVASATVNSVAGKAVAMSFRVGPAETSAGVPKVDASLIEGVDATNQIRDSANQADILQRLVTLLEVAGGSPNEFRLSVDALRNVPAMVRLELAAELARVDVAVSSRASASQATAIEADTQDIQGRLPAALVSGRIDASVGAMAANVMTAAAAAADLTTEIQAGLATASDLATVAGYLDTEILAIKAVTDKLDTTLEVASGSPGDYEFRADALRNAPTGSGGGGGGGLDEAGIRAAVGLASANLDTQLAAIKADTAAAKAVGDKVDTMLEVAAGSPTDYRLSEDALRRVAAVVPTAAATADAVWDEAVSGHLGAGTFGKALDDADDRGARTVIRATVGSGSTTTSIVTSAFAPAGAAADQFKGRIVIFDNDTATAALRGQATDITASSNSATPTLTVTALTTAPSSGDTFSVV